MCLIGGEEGLIEMQTWSTRWEVQWTILEDFLVGMRVGGTRDKEEGVVGNETMVSDSIELGI